MKLKIIVCTSLLSPYRSDWFFELGKKADVEIFSLYASSAERNDSWLKKRPENCSFTIMKGKKWPFFGKISFDFITRIRKNDFNIVILDGYGFCTQLLNMFFLNSKHMDYYVNVDGICPRPNSWREKIVRRIKKIFLSKVPYFLCGSRNSIKELVQYGASESHVIHHPFSSLFKGDIDSAMIAPLEKIQLRKKFDIKEKFCVISVGRFSYLNGYGKGYDVLLKAAKEMSADIGWYIIGGKATMEFEEWKIRENLFNVHFIDYKSKIELQDFYHAADVFVLMTIGDVWGLVVNEAMACGLPVITTDKCVAGNELVLNGKNGYIISVGDVKALQESLDKILKTPELCRRMGRNSLDLIKPYTVEHMAAIHLESFLRNIKKR